MILGPTMIDSYLACMLDIIWNAVEDEYLTVIMYLLCSIPMRFSGKTSQMIHNCRVKRRSRRDQAKTQSVPARLPQTGTLRRENLDHACLYSGSTLPRL